MPSSLKQELEELRVEVKELRRIKYHLTECLITQKCILNSIFFQQIFDFSTITKFTDSDESVWFVTLSYDPKFIHISTREIEYEYYEGIVYQAVDPNDIIHGTYEFTKQGKLHLHFLIQTSQINEFAGKIKPLLTHRLYLNSSLEIVKPSMSKKYEGKGGVEGIYAYMSKENNCKFINLKKNI